MNQHQLLRELNCVLTRVTWQTYLRHKTRRGIGVFLGKKSGVEYVIQIDEDQVWVLDTPHQKVFYSTISVSSFVRYMVAVENYFPNTDDAEPHTREP